MNAGITNKEVVIWIQPMTYLYPNNFLLFWYVIIINVIIIVQCMYYIIHIQLANVSNMH